MPRVGDMFPGRYLSYKQFADGESAVVTIRRVELERIVAQPPRRAGFTGRQQAGAPAPATAEPEWIIWFDEFEKPMKLRKSRAGRIELLLGSDNTDDWIGRVIEIYRGWVQIAGENVEGLLISDRLPSAQQQALGRGDALYNADDAGRLMPADAVGRFVDQIKAAGLSWDEFVAWVKQHSPYGFVALHGVALDAIPRSVLPAMTAYLKALPPKSLPATAAAAPRPPTPMPSVVQPAARPATPARLQVHDEIREDDIPF